MTGSETDWFQFIGRFHVVLVHLPIGFLVLLGLFEVLAARQSFRHLAPASRTLVVAALVATALAAACGWLLAARGDYDPGLISWHKWTGTAMVAAVFALLVLHLGSRKTLYRLCLAGTLILLTITSHHGGSLTHGRGYLTRYAPGSARTRPSSTAALEPTSAGSSAERDALAVLTEYCVSCHGPEKAKAGLRVDTPAALFAGSSSGPAIIPGNADSSLLVHLVELPLEDDDHMPPEGKPQPSAEEIRALREWITHLPSASPP